MPFVEQLFSAVILGPKWTNTKICLLTSAFNRIDYVSSMFIAWVPLDSALVLSNLRDLYSHK